MDVMGTNVTLKVIGDNKSVVKKIGKHDKIAKGISLPDLIANDRKQIIIEIEVSPTKEAEDVTIMNYELTYTPVSRADKKFAPVIEIGTVSVNFTKDSKKLEIENEEVVISAKIQEAALRDKEIATLVELKKVDEAIEKKLELLEDLKKYKEKDKKIAKMLEYAEKDLTVMKKKKDTGKMKKQLDYHGYLEEENSDGGFDSGEDSDSEAYSDKDSEEEASDKDLENSDDDEDSGYSS